LIPGNLKGTAKKRRKQWRAR